MSAFAGAADSYAPQARLFDVTTDQSLEVARHDIVSVVVTQVHHGISQLSLTLNNQRQRAARPEYPPWKYNNFGSGEAAVFKLGQRLRVDFRYAEGPKWHPMILAQVNDLQFSFPSGGGAQVTITGEDLLCLLVKRDHKAQSYPGRHEEEIVGDCLKRSAAGIELAVAKGRKKAFNEPLRHETHPETQTYQQFLQGLAERIDFELFVDFEDHADPSSKIRLHFEEARSLTLGKPVSLAWGRTLTEFNPRFKVREQFTSVTVTGSYPGRREHIREEAGEVAVRADLQPQPPPSSDNKTSDSKKTPSPLPISAIAARRLFFTEKGEHGENPETKEVSNLDKARAKAYAERLLREQARQFLTVEAATIGSPAIRPGVHVDIAGFYAPFDGLYYVTKAVHTLDSGGYKTQFSLRRPGMLNPDLYPAGSNA